MTAAVSLGLYWSSVVHGSAAPAERVGVPTITMTSTLATLAADRFRHPATNRTALASRSTSAMSPQIMDLVRWSGIRLVSGASGRYSTMTAPPSLRRAGEPRLPLVERVPGE